MKTIQFEEMEIYTNNNGVTLTLHVSDDEIESMACDAILHCNGDAYSGYEFYTNLMWTEAKYLAYRTIAPIVIEQIENAIAMARLTGKAKKWVEFYEEFMGE